MSALAPTRVGWCPGALAPMASGDGLILRVKPRGGRLSPEQARAIALVSASCGNGALDLTGRANLQIRGVTEAGLAHATEILDRADLLDGDAAAEAVRNIVPSPLAGFDPTAAFDIAPAVGALEARLAQDRALHALPAKFGFVVDDGGRFGLDDIAADIRFEAIRTETGAAFAVRLGGGEDFAAGRCAPEVITDVAAALARVFLAEQARDCELRRMRDLVGALGADSILCRAGMNLIETPKQPRPARANPLIGSATLPQVVLGIGAPFGRLSAAQLQTIAGLASDTAGLRLTPWRSILVPGLDPAAATALAEAAANAGLIVDPEDARLSVKACTGAPGCHRGSTPVLDHAAELASRLGRSRPGDEILIHVSGCSKGCAHAGKAPLVLVARDGLYDLVADGSASDSPVVSGLTFAESLFRLERLARMEACA